MATLHMQSQSDDAKPIILEVWCQQVETSDQDLHCVEKQTLVFQDVLTVILSVCTLHSTMLLTCFHAAFLLINVKRDNIGNHLYVQKSL